MRENKDELRELIDGLFGAESDDVIVEIETVQKLFEDSKDVKPTIRAVERVKADVLAALKAKSRRQNRYRWLSVATAAGVMLIAGLLMFDESQDIQQVPTASVGGVWANISDETILSCATDELEDIEGELIAIKLGEGNVYSWAEVDEFEEYYLEIETDLWKG